MTAGHLGAVTAAAHRRNPPPPSYTGPLDLTATPAVVAYGQRAMSAAKLGTAVYTIREAGGNTTQSFSSDATTGAVDAAAITTFLNGANGFVTNWNDQSGNASNALQATAGNQPAWAASSGPGGKPALNFVRASNNYLATAADITLPGPGYTVFMVVFPQPAVGVQSTYVAGLNWADSVAANGPDFVVGIVTNDSDFATILGEAEGTGFNGASGAKLNATIPGAYSLIDMAWQGQNTRSVSVDGTAYSPVDGGYDNWIVDSMSFQLAIGNGDAVAPLVTGYFDGPIAEFVIFPAVLSDADRLAIRQNIASWYGITLS